MSIKKKMSMESIIMLNTWLNDDAAKQYLAGEPSYTDAAKLASEAIGTPVTVETLKRCCTAIGVTWTPKKAIKETKLNKDELIKQLKATIAELQQRLDAINFPAEPEALPMSQHYTPCPTPPTEEAAEL